MSTTEMSIDQAYETANARYQEGHVADAEQICRQILAVHPEHAPSLHMLGVIAIRVARFDDALAYIGRSLEHQPNNGPAFANLAVALTHKGRREQAVDAFRQALRLGADVAEIHSNLATVLGDLGRMDESLAEYRRALQLKPHEPEIHWNYSLRLLATGRFAEGWDELEWRLHCKSLNLSREFSKPQWNSQSIAGKTLLVHGEAGHGDSIQFVRYVPLLKDAGATLILECQPALVKLFSENLGVSRVVARGEELPEFDFHIPMPSLPRIFRTTINSIPNQVPYLKAPAEHKAKWQPRMTSDKPKVGLCWSGATHERAQAVPAMSTAAQMGSMEFLAPFAGVKTARFYSLQKGPGTTLPRPPEMQMIDFMDEITDFADTAAVVESLDLVISIDTSIPHLAGALGKPVWLLLPHTCDFRWLMGRIDSPWYPTMRLWRQAGPGQGAAMITQVVDLLNRMRG